MTGTKINGVLAIKVSIGCTTSVGAGWYSGGWNYMPQLMV